MTTQIKRRRGTTTEHNSFTGAEGEITIDTTKDTAVVHDGSTVGGHPLAKEDGSTLTNVNIDSGTIDGVTIGGASAGAGTFTNLTATGTTTLAGATTSADITFGDNDKAIFGAGSDLQIYHDGAQSYIKDVGTGQLRFAASDILFTNAAVTENIMFGAQDGAVTLYHNGASKLATTSTGIDVTGTVTADGLVVDGNGQINGNAVLSSALAPSLTITDTTNTCSTILQSFNTTAVVGTTSNHNFLIYANNLPVANFAAGGDISFYEDTGTTPKLFWDASAEQLGIGTTATGADLHISTTTPLIRLTDTNDSNVDHLINGSGSALVLSADANNELASSTLRFAVDGTERMRIDSDGNVGIGTSSPDAKMHISDGGGAGLEVIPQTSNDRTTLLSYDRNTSTYQTLDTDASDVHFNIAGSEAMRIDSSGRVGIGTSSPNLGSSGYGLHIKGAATKDGIIKLDSSDSNTSGWVQFSENGTDQWRIAYDPTNNHLEFTESGVADRMVIQDGGNVGIGTSSPSTKFHVVGSMTTGGTNPTYYFGGSGTSGNNGYIQKTTGSDYALTIVGSNSTNASVRAPIVFKSGTDTERMRIDSDGNVGIGTSSPSASLTIREESANYEIIEISRPASDVGALYLGTVGTNDAAISANNSNLTFGIVTSGVYAERMRIDSSGNLLVGCTAYPSASVTGFAVRDLSYGWIHTSYNSTSTRSHHIFYNPNGAVGSITTSGSSTAFNTSSDYRLKENVVDMTGAVDRVKALNPSQFNFIADPDKTVDGFLAHEVSDVVPEAVTGTKDAMQTEEYEVTPAVLDDDGNVVTEAVMGTREVPEYQGIDQSKLVPLLTGALQEAIARIETLEAQVATLQGN